MTDDRVHDMVTVLGNDQTLYHMVRIALAERLRNGMGYYDMVGDVYMGMVAHDGIDTVARDASDAVSEATQDRIIRRLGGDMFIPDDSLALLVNAMFDFDNRDLWAEITERFLPESAEDYDEMMSDYGL